VRVNLTPLPPPHNEIIPATPQSSQDSHTVSNETTAVVPDTLGGVTLPDFYTSPMSIPPTIGPTVASNSVTAPVSVTASDSVTESESSDAPDRIPPPKKSSVSASDSVTEPESITESSDAPDPTPPQKKSRNKPSYK
jgi:hypothetical protein